MAENGGLRILKIADGDSRMLGLPETGAVEILLEERNGQHLLVGQSMEYREDNKVLIWRVLAISDGNIVWHNTDRTNDVLAVLGPRIIVRGMKEIEIWESNARW